MSNKHQCEGKDCLTCKTCIFDKPLEDDYNTAPLRADKLCNYCGYLIKQYKDHDSKFFNACCGKEKIEFSEYSRPRTIDFRVYEGDDIKKPVWCPKLKEDTNKGTNEVDSQKLTYTERRNRLKNLAPHMDWSQFTPGKTYVIPSILGKKRKILLLKHKTDFTLVFNDVKEDGTVLDIITNIFKTDIETNFIVERKNF
jgi:hypothetical protein